MGSRKLKKSKPDLGSWQKKKFSASLLSLLLVMSLVFQSFGNTIRAEEIAGQSDVPTVETSSETPETDPGETEVDVPEVTEPEETLPAVTEEASSEDALSQGNVAERPSAGLAEVSPFAEISDTANMLDSFAMELHYHDGTSIVVSDGDEIEVDVPQLNYAFLDLYLKRPDGVVLQDGDTYTLDLPSFFDGFVTYAPISISGHIVATYAVANQKIVITFLEAIEDYDNVEMHLELNGVIDVTVFENVDKVEVNYALLDNETYEVTLIPKQEAYEGTDKKTAGSPYYLDGTTKVPTTHNPTHVDWTVIANDSAKDISSAKVIDELGANMALVPGSIQVWKIIRNNQNVETSRELVTVTPTMLTSGFEIDLGDIENAYEITYTTTLIRPNGGGNRTINNKARIVLDGDTNNVQDDVQVSWSGDIPVIQKDGWNKNGDVNRVVWRVKYNYGQENLGTVTLTDVLTHGAVDINTVVIQQKRVNADGNPYGNNNGNIGAPISNEGVSLDTSGNLVIANLDANGKAYEITFESTIPVGLNNTTITNTITDDRTPPNSDDATVTGNTIPSGGKVGEQKVDANGNPYIEWTITMNSSKVNVGSIIVRDVFDPEMLTFDPTNTSLYSLKQNGVDTPSEDYTVASYAYDGTDPDHAGKTGFRLAIPDAGPNEYKFVYRTYYTVKGMQEPELANHAELLFLDGDGDGIGDSIDVNYDLTGPLAGISKNGYYYDHVVVGQPVDEQIQWEITFNQSKIMLEAGATLTDTFTSGNYSYIPGTFVVEPSINHTFTLTASGFTLTLNEATKETITVRYRTTADDQNNLDQVNDVSFTWQGGTEEADHTVEKRDPGIWKTGDVIVYEDGSKSINWRIYFNTNRHVVFNFVLNDTNKPSTSTISAIKIMSGDDDETSTFTISDVVNGVFSVSKTRLEPKQYVLTYISTLSPAEEQEQILNKADIAYTGGTDSDDHGIPNPELIVEKEANSIGRIEGFDNPVIAWTIRANTDAAKHRVNLVDAVLLDTIPLDQALVLDSIKVYRVGSDVDIASTLTIAKSANEFTINLPDGTYEYTVTFQTETLYIPTEDNQVFDRYRNDVTLTNQTKNDDLKQEDSDSATIRLFGRNDPALVEKTSTGQNPETENIDYEVVVNRQGLTIPNAKIEDVLSLNHNYVTDTFKVYKGLGDTKVLLTPVTDYSLSFESTDTKRGFTLTFTSGEIDTPYTIAYSTRLNGNLVGVHNATNTITLKGGDGDRVLDNDSNTSVAQQWFYGGGGSGTQVDLQVKKVDGLAAALAGATFELYRVNLSNVETLVTDAEIDASQEGITIYGKIRAGRYKLVETDSPTGFTLLGSPIYLMIGYKAGSTTEYVVTITNSSWAASTHTHASASDNVLTVTNDIQTGTVAGRKVWSGLTSQSVSGVYLKLFRNLPGGAAEAVPGAALKAVTGAQAEESASWDNVELYVRTAGGAAEAYEFTVREVNADGEDYTPAGFVKVESGLTVYNMAVNPTFTVTKTLSGRPLLADEFAFVLVDEHDNEFTARNDADGKVVFTNFLTMTAEQIAQLASFEQVVLTYTLSETVSTLGGVTSDPTVHTITVALEIDSETNAFKEVVIETDQEDFTFSNAYVPAGAEVTLEATKVLTDRYYPLADGEFSFEVVDQADAVVASGTNDADGKISFSAITLTSVGTYTYTIREVAGSDANIDHDDSAFTVTIVVTDDLAGQLHAQVTYPQNGVVFTNAYDPQMVSVGDYVWEDVNRDGLQDATDIPLEGVILTLVDQDGEPVTDVYGNLVAPTTTDEDGWYAFVNLPVTGVDGYYTVIVTAPAGYLPTIDNAGDRDEDSDAAKGYANSTALPNDGDHDPTLDFGFVKPYVTVGDYVWFDVNRDGMQDETDIPLEGVELILVDQDGEPVTDVLGNVVPSTFTDEDGWYEFTYLPVTGDDGYYTVKVVAPAGYIPTTDNVGDREGDSDAEKGYANSSALPEHLDEDLTLDFGFVIPKVSVGDYVWEDVNRDGLQDETDIPLEGVILTIEDQDGNPVLDIFGNPVGPTTTDENGWYEFVNLPITSEDGFYRVKVVTPDGYMPTTPNVGDDRSVDSSTDYADSVALPNDGDHDPTLDFGFVRPYVTVGDYVWEDVNRDGRQDETDIPLEGVELILVDQDGEPVTDVLGNVVPSTFTDEDGWYEFTYLPVTGDDGYYTVKVVAPAGYIPTTDNVGDREGDSDAAKGYANSTALPEHLDEDLTLDFGFVRPYVTVGDYVWFDVNRDGLQDETDIPLEGVELILVDQDGEPVTDVFGNVVPSTVTDENGWYEFTYLPVTGEDDYYTVKVVAPAGYIPTTDNVGDREGDSDAAKGYANSTALPEHLDEDLTLDFGFVIPKVSVGDYVWEDVNGDGRQDETDRPLEGVELTIEDQDGNPVTDIYGNPVGPTTTDENGWYEFKDLPVTSEDGYYRVRVKTPNGYESTTSNVGDRSGDSDKDYADSVGLPNDGDHDPTLDFGFTRVPGQTPDTEEKPDPTPTPTPTPDKPKVPGTGEESSMLPLLGFGLLAGAASLIYLQVRRSQKRREEEN